MIRLRRLITWSFVLGLLTATGVGVFHFVRYRPRLTIGESTAINHLSADGQCLVAGVPADGGSSELHVWDLRTGVWVRSIPVSGRGVLSPDKTLYAFCQRDQPIQMVHWQTGVTWQIPVPARTWDNSLLFSPGSRWLRVVARDLGPSDCIIDLSNRKVAWRSDRRFLGFTNDDRHVVCHAQDTTITVHDAATGREVARLKSDTHPEADTGCLQSPNGRWLVTLITSGRYEEEKYVGDLHLNPRESDASQGRSERGWASHRIGRLPICGFEVWNAADGRKIWRVERPKRDQRAFCFSPDSRRVATWYAHRRDQDTYEAEFFEFATGKRIAVMPLKAHGEGRFSDDGELFLYREDGPFTITLFDVANERILWEKPCNDVGEGVYDDWFVGDTHRVHYASANPRRLEFLNPETGDADMILSKDFPWAKKTIGRHCIAFAGKWERSKILPDIPCLTDWWTALFGQRERVLVVADNATGQEQIRLLRPFGLDFLVSEDGGTLITTEPSTTAAAGDESREIHVWNVHPQRAWFWAIAWPLTLGIGLLLVRRWRLKPKATT